MSDKWKELNRSEELESRPLRSKGAMPTQGANYATASPEEADVLNTGFQIREMGLPAIRLWVGFQVLSLLFQFSLWREVSSNLAVYEDVVERECSGSSRHHGVCTGLSWNLSWWEDFVLQGPANSQTASHYWDFSTKSNPPTYAIVVDPVAESKDGEVAAAPEDLRLQTADLDDVRWSVEVVRRDPPQVGSWAMKKINSGQQAFTVEDLSAEVADMLTYRSEVFWRVTVSLQAPLDRKTRFLVYVEDAAQQHLKQIHDNPQCVFGRSWKAFNEQHQGRSHRALVRCEQLLGMLFIVGAASVYFVWKKVADMQRHAVISDSRRFHMIVMAKFFLQDLPQQICIVLYVLGWYEESGLRCQLCLFDVKYCSTENPFHLFNLIAFGSTLVSALCNQLLIRPVLKRVYSEDDLCIQYFVRIGGMCLSVLPFTTGLCCASRSILPSPVIYHLVFAFPCAIGWLTLAGLVCLPFTVWFDEDTIL